MITKGAAGLPSPVADWEDIKSKADATAANMWNSTHNSTGSPYHNTFGDM